MSGLTDVTRTTIGKKLLNGLTGLLLCGFIVGHLTGNLLLLVGREAFNEYAYFLHNLGHGAVVPIMEAGLIAIFLTHAFTGINVAITRRRARPQRYERVANAGGRSRKTIASKSMVVTGSVLLVFVVLHVAQFKFGVGQLRDYPDVMIDGHASLDLYSRVVDWFNQAPMVGLYVVVMLLLGTHLRHGFWSMFQTLGANNPKYMPIIYTAGLAFAAVMAVGFLMIPVYIFLFVDPVVGGSMLAG